MYTCELCKTITLFNIKKKGFSDLTGAFPHKSRRGDLHFMFMYDYDRNAILDEPIKNRQAVTIRDSFFKFNKVLKTRSKKPKVYIM